MPNDILRKNFKIIFLGLWLSKKDPYRKYLVGTLSVKKSRQKVTKFWASD